MASVDAVYDVIFAEFPKVDLDLEKYFFLNSQFRIEVKKRVPKRYCLIRCQVYKLYYFYDKLFKVEGYDTNIVYELLILDEKYITRPHIKRVTGKVTLFNGGARNSEYLIINNFIHGLRITYQSDLTCYAMWKCHNKYGPEYRFSPEEKFIDFRINSSQYKYGCFTYKFQESDLHKKFSYKCSCVEGCLPFKKLIPEYVSAMDLIYL